MKRISLLRLSLFFLFPVFSTDAQPIPFYTDPLWSSAQFTPFVDGKEVKGYCALFCNPVLNNYSNYSLEILDSNFKVVKKSNIVIPKATRIKHGSFNGSAISVTLESFSGILIKNQVYDLDGYLLAEYELGKKGMLSNSKVYAVPYTGFVGNAQSPDQERILEMRSDSGLVLWTIYPEIALMKDDPKGAEEKISIHSVDHDFLLVKCEVPDKKAAEIRGNAKMYYRLYDLLSGKKIADLRKDEEERILIPYGVTPDTNSFLVYGQYYFADKSPMGFNGNESLGIYIHEYGSDGVFKKEYYYPWNDLASSVKMSDDNSNTSVWLNDLSISPSGTVFLMGELYRYSKESGVGDAVVFEFNKFDQVPKVHVYPRIFDKAPISILSPNDYLFGENMHDAESFGYRYSSATPDTRAFSFVYSNSEGSGRKKKYVISAIGFNRDQELVSANFTLKSSPDRIRVLPSKNGYVAVVEYYYDLFFGILRYYKLDM